MIKNTLGCLYRDRYFRVDDFARLQKRLLTNLVRHAASNVPFYRQYFSSSSPADFSLEQLPIVDKEMIMENFSQFLGREDIEFEDIAKFTRDKKNIGQYFKEKYLVALTSGTTGRVGYFLYDVSTWSAFRGAVTGRVLRHRLTPYQVSRFSYGRRYKMAMVVANHGHYITYLLSLFNPGLFKLITDIENFSILEKLDTIVTQLNKFQPHFLHGYPTHFELLAYAKMEGSLKIDPEFISLGSEPLSPRTRKIIGNAFKNAFISESYGTSECLVLANQCCHGRLHLNSDFCIIEGVDENNRPVPSGQPSHKILITNLLNYIQPIIRYELTDSVTFTGEKCGCGIQLPVIQVHGRTDDIFYLHDQQGKYHTYPPIAFEVLFLEIEGLKQYQLIHESQNRLRILFVSSFPSHSGKTAREIKKRFYNYLEGQNLLDQITLIIEEVKAISRPANSQKIRQILSLVSPPDRRVGH